MDNNTLKKFDAFISPLSRKEVKRLTIAYVLARSIGYITLTDITIENILDDGALKLGKRNTIYLGFKLTDSSPRQYLQLNETADGKWTTTQSLRWYGREVDLAAGTEDTGEIGSIKILPETLRNCWRATGSKTRLVQDCTVDGTGYQLRLSFDVVAAPKDKLKSHMFFIDVISLLAMIYARLYERRRILKDLEAAISQQVLLKYLVQSVFACTPLGMTSSDASKILDAIAYTLRALHKEHYAHTGDLADLTKSITVLEPVIARAETRPTGVQHGYFELGHDYMVLYRTTCVESYGEKARLYSRKASMLFPDNFTFVNGLATVLLCSFEVNREPPYIEEALTTARRAITLARGLTETAVSTETLALCLSDRFKLTFSRLDDIDEAIYYLRTATTLFDNNLSDRWRQFINLAKALHERFCYSGQLVDLEEAISLAQNAIDIRETGAATGSRIESDIGIVMSPLGTNFTAGLHHDLAMLKMTRFEWTSILSDLEEAIVAGRKSVELTDEGDPGLPGRLSQLGSYLKLRFNELNALHDIREAIYLQKRALALTPVDHSDFRIRSGSLSRSYGVLAGSGQDPDAFDQSVAFGRASINGIDESSQGRLGLLHDFADALLRRNGSDAHRQPQDLEVAVDILRQAIRGAASSDAKLGGILLSLADALFLQGTSNGQSSPPAECVELLENVANSHIMDPHIRLRACRNWIAAATLRGDLDTAFIRAYTTTLKVLALVVGLEHTMEQRHKIINDFKLGPTMAQAAAVGITMGKVDKALEWLEQGRSLVWNQLNSLRTPLDELWDHDQTVARRVLRVSRALERVGGRRSTTALDAPFGQRISHQHEVLRHAQLVKEWEELLQVVRSIHGFDRFLMPPSYSDLFSNLPQGGHVVVINVHGGSCNAIALRSGCHNPVLISLPKFSESQAICLSKELHANLVSSGVRYRSDYNIELADIQSNFSDDKNRAMKPYKQSKSPEIGFVKILRELWTDLVKPIIDALGITPSDSPGRIWWCPTGTLAFLPIHAAGIYSSTSTHHSILSDYAISSYIPTVSSLTSIIKHRPNVINASAGLMIVAQANTPGLPALPGTVQEAIDVDAQMVVHGVRTSILEGEQATTGGVIENMKDFSCIHLACHATQDQATPLDSAFHLHNGRLQLRSIVKHNLRNADLAFLSACQTSTGASGLSDEAAHLAGGMMAAGYRGVVASMWSLQDVHAPTVAKNFYAELLRRGGGRIDGSQAAYALHHSIQMLRAELGDDSPLSFLAWAPYVHFGL